ncbi:DUF3108 domain-containing protein [Candidatus Neomarinimicrobiota bacterium]
MKLSVKINSVFIVIFFWICANSALFAQFKVGEELVYKARFNVIPAGKASLKVMDSTRIDDHLTYHVRFNAKTGSLADRIYKIRDQIDSWLDVEKLFAHKQIKSIREGDYRKKIQTTFNYEEGYAVTNDDSLAVNGIIYDTYSLLYYLRTIPLIVGETHSFQAFEKKKLIDFQIKVYGKETIPVPVGTFTCFVVKPFREDEKLFKNQGDMKIWLSDDANRLPVQIQIKLKYGSMLLQLKSVTL